VFKKLRKLSQRIGFDCRLNPSVERIDLDLNSFVRTVSLI